MGSPAVSGAIPALATTMCRPPSSPDAGVDGRGQPDPVPHIGDGGVGVPPTRPTAPSRPDPPAGPGIAVGLDVPHRSTAMMSAPSAPASLHVPGPPARPLTTATLPATSHSNLLWRIYPSGHCEQIFGQWLEQIFGLLRSEDQQRRTAMPRSMVSRLSTCNSGPDIAQDAFPGSSRHRSITQRANISPGGLSIDTSPAWNAPESSAFISRIRVSKENAGLLVPGEGLPHPGQLDPEFVGEPVEGVDVEPVQRIQLRSRWNPTT